MSPKSRAGASKDEPQSSKKPESSGTGESAASKKRATAKAGAAAGKARAGAAKGEPDGTQARQTSTAADTPNAPEPGRQAGGRIRTLDFSQPTKFTTEIRRRISGAIEQFCEALSGRLTNELAVEVEFSVAEVDQHTWAAAKARLAADAVAVAVEAKAIERQMLLSVEQPLMLQALECLLGGQAAQAPSERHLTDIDWVLARSTVRWDRRRAVERLGRARRPAADTRRGRFGGRRRRLRAGRRADLRRSRSRAGSTASRPRCHC